MNESTTDPLGNRLAHCYTGAVYDVLRAMGHPNQVLPSSIRPLDPAQSLAGRIYTVGATSTRPSTPT